MLMTVLGTSPVRRHHNQDRVYEVNIHERLSPTTGGNGNDQWQYCSFKASKDISVVSLGIAGPPENAIYRVRAKIVEEPEPEAVSFVHTSHHGHGRKPMSILQEFGGGETETLAYAAAGGVYHVPLKQAVQIQAGKWYRAYVYLSEGPASTFYGLAGRTSEDVFCGFDCNVNFEFQFNDGQPYAIGFRV